MRNKRIISDSDTTPGSSNKPVNQVTDEKFQHLNQELIIANKEKAILTEQLTAAKNYAETIVDNIRVPMMVLDENLRIKTANPSFYKAFHVNEEDTLGTLIYDLGNQQWNIPSLRKLLEEILPTQSKIIDYEVRHLFDEMGERIMILNAHEIINNNKSEKLILLSIEDITERNIANKKIEESGNHYRNLVEGLPVAVYTCDAAGHILLFNKAAVELWGREPKSGIDKWWFSWNVFNTDGTLLSHEQCPMAIALNDGRMMQFEIIVALPDGTRRNVIPYSQPIFDNNGLIQGAINTLVDITEAKKGEESNAKLAAIVQSSEDAIISKTLQGIVTSWNPGAEKLLGYKSEEMIGQSITKIIPNERIDEEPEIINKILAGKTIDHFETQRCAKGGKLIDISLTISPIKNNSGVIIGASKIARDITKEIDARKKIEESEKRFYNLIFSSPSAIAILNGPDLVITIANESILDMWGKGKEVIGKKYFEVLPELIDQGFQEIFEQVYKTGIPYHAFETPINFLHNGVDNLKYYNFILFPQRNLMNEINGIGIIATEVTTQAIINKNIKESEERFRTLTQTLPQLIWVTDAKGNAEFASSRWEEYTGIEPAGEKEWKEIVHPEDYDKISSVWLHSLTTGNFYESDVRLKSKEGNYRWHTLKGEPVLDQEKKIVKWIGALTDIHDQKINEEKKDEFIGIASHEMKTPLTTAKAYLQMLELSLDEKDSNSRVYAKKANQSVDRLNELIAELLDVSKIRLGKLNYTLTNFNFNDLIDDTVVSFQLTAPTHKIIKSGKVTDKITGDKERLQQVVINLLSNAIKYAPNSNEVFITIAQEKNKTIVSVKDTGIGIAQKNLNKIFEKYHRIEEKSVHFQGLGIGLFISYEIIQRHNGELWVESEEGKGSTFYFSLPIDLTKNGDNV